ncbi:collagen binding domain-containing protein [Bacillus sp. OxB-1]|uniref:collagen binding domain-containing protein n=1 Tax=Bacillus sp. (strain OxB-1) TaxID=98228 RepID=UPI00130E5CC9|nr:collagen binding domain-containing protein [Bacillus sp. OxB-1]
MKKWLNIMMLTLLLLGQTVLGPVGMVWADELPDAGERQEESTTKETTTDESGQPAEESGNSDTDGSDDNLGSTEEEGQPGDNTNNEEGDGGTSPDDSTSPPKEPGDNDGDDSDAPAAGEGAPDSPVEGEDIPTPPTEDEPPNVPAAGIMPDSVITSTEFTVGGQPVTGTGPVTVQNGQKAEFKFNLELAAGHNYGPGSTLTYTLPGIFTDITFPQGTTFGDLGEIEKSDNVITITFNSNIHDGLNGTGFEPGAHFFIEATFNNTGDNINETIDLPGRANIALNFTPLNGSAITKDNGTPYPGNQNSEHIEWKVTVNTDLKASGTVEFKDTLTGGHTFDQNTATITELTMKPDGAVLSRIPATGVSPNFTSDTEMTISLDGVKAYEITYHTIPDDPGNNESVTYLNDATYNDTPAPTRSATVNYGTPLNKKGSLNSANLETTWTIEYNYNKRTISQPNAKLTDTWSTSGGSSTGTVEQKMVDESFEVRDGNGDIVNNYTLTSTAQGFGLQFNSEVTDAYTITYKTKPTDGSFITSDMTVTNTVVREDSNISKSPSVTYNKTSFMLNKSANDSPNYEAKTMDWTITANQAGYDLAANTKFTDTFMSKNMTLDEDTLVVTVDGVPLSRGTGYTLTNNGKVGFDITLLDGTNGQVVIKYTTGYDIRDVGMNDRKFHNSVTIMDSGLPVAPSDSAEHSVTPEQTANGKKDGKYNYETKKFEWEVELNFNLNTLEDAIFEDVLPDTQTVDVDSIKVLDGTLNPNGTFKPGNEVSVTNTATEPNKIAFSLGKITGPYKVTYESYDTDDVFPETTGKVQITNNATLKDGTTPNASWTKTVGINYTDKLIKKKGSQINQTAGIKWNFEFNYAQSNLKNIVITDTVGKDGDDGDGNPNQLIKADSFKVYKVELSGKSDSAGFNATKQNTLLSGNEYELNVDIQEGTFTLKLPDGDSAYYIEYETIYMGDNDSTVTNVVQVNYVSEDGTQASNEFSISNFRYGNAGKTVKVPFVVVKTDGATGEAMEGVEFTLYSEFQPGVPLISKKTDANGIFDLGMKLTEGKYTLKETTVAGYENPGDIDFTLHRDSIATGGPHVGKQIVEVENWKTGVNVCTEFTLTIKDVDRNPVAGKTVTVTNNATGDIHSTVTNGAGEITLLPANVKAGKYTVTTDDGGTEVILGDIAVTYDGDCKDEIAPTPSCDEFTITIEDKDNIARPNVTVTLKHKTDATAPEITATTDANGKFTVPSDTTQTGEYKVYEGKQYLGDVTITYKNDPCAATVTEAPTCETFTLTVRDVDGKSREAGVEITIKDKDGNVIETLTTDGDGKVTTTGPLPAGEYDVFEGNSATPFDEFAVNIDCTADVQPAPACTDFTLIVKDENGDVRSNVSVTVKDIAGNSIKTAPTNVDGEITIPSKELPAGKYNVFEGELLIGQIEVSYLVDCQAEVQGAPTCEDFTLTIQNRNGNARPNVQVTVKDAAGDIIVTDTTDANGQLAIASKLKQGTYRVYEGSSLINSFTVKDTCSAIVKPRPIPTPTPPPATCIDFTLTVYENGELTGAGIEVVLKSGETEIAKGTTDANGKITIQKNQLQDGQYDAYVNGEKVGDVTVSDSCADEIDLPKVPACNDFTVTVKEDGNPVEAGKEVVLKLGDEEIVTGTTDKNGKVVFPKDQLLNGEYDAYVDGEKVGKVTVADSCEETITLTPAPVCEDFTVTVKENGELVEAGKEVVLKSGDTEIARGTTDTNGKIVFAKADLPAGTYTVYDENDKAVGSVLVSYEEGKCQAIIDVLPKVCEDFTLTITDRPFANVVVKDLIGNVIVTGVTDNEGNVTFTTLLPQGSYVVTVNNDVDGHFNVTENCSATVTLESNPGNGGGSGGGGGGGGGTPPTTPVDPNKPGESGKPGDPNKPGESGKPGDPNKPGESGKPGDPNKPGESGNPGDPNKPGESGKPGDPNKPGESGKPDDPNKPGESGKPGDPNKPGESGKPGDPNKPGESGKPGDPNKPGESGKPVDPNKPGESGKLGNPNKLGESSNQIDSKTPTNGKILPQTGEAYPIVPMAAGLTLILAGLWMLRRKTLSIKQ